MNIQHLKYAVEVERAGSITDAAESLYISQPSLSKAIREMETSLGFAVFERTARGVIPTRRGRQLLDHAYAILRQMSQIEALSSGEEAGSQSLSLCAPRAGYVAEAALRFCARLDARKGLSVRLSEACAAQALDGVADGRFRLGVIRYPQREDASQVAAIEKRGLRSEPVWTFEPMVLTSAAGPLVRAGAAELEAAVEVRCDESCSLQRAGTARSVSLGDRSLLGELLLAVPGSYAWASPLPPALLERRGLRQLRAESVPEKLCDRLVFSGDGAFSPGERAFLDLLFQVKNEAAFDREL